MTDYCDLPICNERVKMCSGYVYEMQVRVQLMCKCVCVHVSVVCSGGEGAVGLRFSDNFNLKNCLNP